MANELLKLAERCEKATGPDRFLDGEIGAAMQRLRVEAAGGNASGIRADDADAGHVHETMGAGWRAPKFTASLDAAMTLVPEGWDWSSGTNGKGGGLACYRGVHDFGTPVETVEAATPALALCAAALRARASQKDAEQ